MYANGEKYGWKPISENVGAYTSIIREDNINMLRKKKKKRQKETVKWLKEAVKKKEAKKTMQG